MSISSPAFTSPLRVRFAPSPTGYLHVGGARTALYCYLIAKNRGGTFVLRVEDTDEARSTDESMQMQLADLEWLGLNWNEGPHPKTFQDMGPHGPYRQSQRKYIYQQYAIQLLESGHAYYCFMTDAEMEAKKSLLHPEGQNVQFNSPYRDMSALEAKRRVEQGEPATIRFKTPLQKKNYVLKDLIRGEVVFPSDMVGDFVLVRSSGMPVYNFCCVVDDALMNITHVLRAEEHLSNTLRQMMIYEGLGIALPEFGHLSIILGPDKQKLSKRHGATSCNEYRLSGFLPEALNNFIALLGWSSPKGQEIMSMKEMIEQISLDRFNPSPAVFDEVKLRWVNATHLRALSHKELWGRLKPFLDEAGLQFSEDPDWQDRALSLMKSYMETLKDGIELFRPLSRGDFQVLPEAKETMEWESTPAVIAKWRELLIGFRAEYLSESDFLAVQEQVKSDCGAKGKFLFMPIRVAVLGKPHGAELKILVPLLEKSLLIERAEKVLSAFD
ncbi:MAG: glutamate--tRNA ligase [Bdellovibrionales bacterium]|nr:glutamate--tRNA ligase [Bdellovibrionales bacterium]